MEIAARRKRQELGHDAHVTRMAPVEAALAIARSRRFPRFDGAVGIVLPFAQVVLGPELRWQRVVAMIGAGDRGPDEVVAQAVEFVRRIAG